MSYNPFKHISDRLTSIEALLLDLKHSPNVQNDLEEVPISIEPASDVLNLAKPTIYSKVSKGELPHIKKGGRLFFYRSELIEYLNQGRKKTNAELQDEAHTSLKQKGGEK